MCVTTRKERENDRLKAILSSKTDSLPLYVILSHHPPKTDDEKYAYDIIQKTYWINEKKIEMLDSKKDQKLLKDYYKYLVLQKSKLKF